MKKDRVQLETDYQNHIDCHNRFVSVSATLEIIEHCIIYKQYRVINETVFKTGLRKLLQSKEYLKIGFQL